MIFEQDLMEAAPAIGQLIIEHIWDLNTVIDETSVFGELLKTLFGYNANPSLSEMIGYFAHLVVVLFLFRRSAVTRGSRLTQPQA
jgi:high-affinity Fe2+/Pb2+ permease